LDALYVLEPIITLVDGLLQVRTPGGSAKVVPPAYQASMRLPLCPDKRGLAGFL
jgi:hypothetical protein